MSDEGTERCTCERYPHASNCGEPFAEFKNHTVPWTEHTAALIERKKALAGRSAKDLLALLPTALALLKEAMAEREELLESDLLARQNENYARALEAERDVLADRVAALESTSGSPDKAVVLGWSHPRQHPAPILDRLQRTELEAVATKEQAMVAAREVQREWEHQLSSLRTERDTLTTELTELKELLETQAAMLAELPPSADELIGAQMEAAMMRGERDALAAEVNRLRDDLGTKADIGWHKIENSRLSAALNESEFEVERLKTEYEMACPSCGEVCKASYPWHEADGQRRWCIICSPNDLKNERELLIDNDNLRFALAKCATKPCPFEDDGRCKPNCTCASAIALGALKEKS